MTKLKACEQMPKHPDSAPPEVIVSTPDSGRKHIAVASLEGMLVNQHLGEAYRLLIYADNHGSVELIDERKTPEPGNGTLRWKIIAGLLRDCHTLLVSGIGKAPRAVLENEGITVIEVEGVIDEAAGAVFSGSSLNHIMKRERKACGVGCSGTGMGCG